MSIETEKPQINTNETEIEEKSKEEEKKPETNQEKIGNFLKKIKNDLIKNHNKIERFLVRLASFGTPEMQKQYEQEQNHIAQEANQQKERAQQTIDKISLIISSPEEIDKIAKENRTTDGSPQNKFEIKTIKRIGSKSLEELELDSKKNLETTEQKLTKHQETVKANQQIRENMDTIIAEYPEGKADFTNEDIENIFNKVKQLKQEYPNTNISPDTMKNHIIYSLKKEARVIKTKPPISPSEENAPQNDKPLDKKEEPLKTVDTELKKFEDDLSKSGQELTLDNAQTYLDLFNNQKQQILKEHGAEYYEKFTNYFKQKIKEKGPSDDEKSAIFDKLEKARMEAEPKTDTYDKLEENLNKNRDTLLEIIKDGTQSKEVKEYAMRCKSMIEKTQRTLKRIPNIKDGNFDEYVRIYDSMDKQKIMKDVELSKKSFQDEYNQGKITREIEEFEKSLSPSTTEKINQLQHNTDIKERVEAIRKTKSMPELIKLYNKFSGEKKPASYDSKGQKIQTLEDQAMDTIIEELDLQKKFLEQRPDIILKRQDLNNKLDKINNEIDKNSSEPTFLQNIGVIESTLTSIENSRLNQKYTKEGYELHNQIQKTRTKEELDTVMDKIDKMKNETYEKIRQLNIDKENNKNDKAINHLTTINKDLSRLKTMAKVRKNEIIAGYI